MNCPNCEASVPVGAEYCPSCGRPLPVWCGSCGEANERANNYCFRCGSRLSEQEPAPEAIVVGPAGSAAVCPRCHQPNEPNSTYCYSCGIPLEQAGGGRRGVLAERPDAPAFSIGRPAGFWIRLPAFLIDVLLLAGVFIIAWPLLSGQTLGEVRDSLLFSEEPITGGGHL